MYLIPPGGASAATAASVELVVSVNATAINSTASNVHFENLQISYAQGNGMELRGSNISVVNCTVSNHGALGISIAGIHNRVVGSHVHDVGCAGLAVYSGARNASLIPGNAQIVGNTIHANSLWKRMYQPAIAFDSVGDSFTHNTMYDGPHSGMLGHAVETTFSHNNFSESTNAVPGQSSHPAISVSRGCMHVSVLHNVTYMTSRDMCCTARWNAQLSFAPRAGTLGRGTPVALGPTVGMSSLPTILNAFATLEHRSRCKGKTCIVSTLTIRYTYFSDLLTYLVFFYPGRHLQNPTLIRARGCKHEA